MVLNILFVTIWEEKYEPKQMSSLAKVLVFHKKKTQSLVLKFSFSSLFSPQLFLEANLSIYMKLESQNKVKERRAISSMFSMELQIHAYLFYGITNKSIKQLKLKKLFDFGPLTNM